MSTTISDQGLATQDSSEARVYIVDYDAENLAAGVSLVNAGTFVITPASGAPTQDNQGLIVGNRLVRLRLSGGTVGVTYKVEHTVQTDELPAQTKSKWFLLRITE